MQTPLLEIVYKYVHGIQIIMANFKLKHVFHIVTH